MMDQKIKLYPHQEKAISELRTGSVLEGGVGSGKSLTALSYFYSKELGGNLGGEYLLPSLPTNTMMLYVITTAKKRDSLDWENEAVLFNIDLKVDSWNNINKYKDVKDAFFIFDEQKVIGSGAWVKAFLKITRHNKWILLTATPGDTWMDYIPVFIANGFFKNRTEFTRDHIVYTPYLNYPKIERFVGEEKLQRLKRKIIVNMKFKKETIAKHIDVVLGYNKDLMFEIEKNRWNVFDKKPIKTAAELCYLMRRVVNTDSSRLSYLRLLLEKHSRLLVFYNFDYELNLLRTLEEMVDFRVAEYNGHLHEDIPKSNRWIYLVQYAAGSESWNCIETNAIVFYSLNYSYKATTQAAGRIDRLTTPFQYLFYYYFISDSVIDRSIIKALKNKTEFNEKRFIRNNKIDFDSREKHRV